LGLGNTGVSGAVSALASLTQLTVLYLINTAVSGSTTGLLEATALGECGCNGYDY
jgi:hypothetical protein